MAYKHSVGWLMWRHAVMSAAMVLIIILLPITSLNAEFTGIKLISKALLKIGDWTAPTVEWKQIPAEVMYGNDVHLSMRALDDFSNIARLEIKLYQAEESDPDNWISILVLDKKPEIPDAAWSDEIMLDFRISTVHDANEKLCAENNLWCDGQNIPEGSYYLAISAFDDSKTINERGNMSQVIRHDFQKRNANIICNIQDIKAKAGETIQLPDVQCENEPILTDITWDMDETDGIDFSQQGLSKNAPLFENGYLMPGTYTVHVRSENIIQQAKISSFIIDVANPEIGENDVSIEKMLPDPNGDDNAPQQGGEWVMIKNNLHAGVDVLGFTLYDALDGHDLPITRSNTPNGVTAIQPGSCLQVYRNADPHFSLNNGEETVRLMDGFIENNSTIISTVRYEGNVPEGKMWEKEEEPIGGYSWTDSSSPECAR